MDGWMMDRWRFIYVNVYRLADTLVQLNLEQNTWQLAAVLYTDRLTMDQNNVEDMTVDRVSEREYLRSVDWVSGLLDWF